MTRNTRHDFAQRRKAQRHGRERGCWVYIPAEQLERAGVTLADTAPTYQIWDGRKRTVLVQLYEEDPKPRERGHGGRGEPGTEVPSASDETPALRPPLSLDPYSVRV